MVTVAGALVVVMTSVNSNQFKIGGLPFPVKNIRGVMSMGLSDLPSFAGYTFMGLIDSSNLYAQAIGAITSYAGNKLVVGTSYMIQFSGSYVTA